MNNYGSVVWAGGAELEVNPEYWRISTNSTTVLDCPLPSAWLGGYYPQETHPVKWETGYKGYLCTEWDIVDGVKYVKTSGNQCAKWNVEMINVLKFVGLILLAFIFSDDFNHNFNSKEERKSNIDTYENAYKLPSIDFYINVI